jgi:hypothetical protein
VGVRVRRSRQRQRAAAVVSVQGAARAREQAQQTQQHTIRGRAGRLGGRAAKGDCGPAQHHGLLPGSWHSQAGGWQGLAQAHQMKLRPRATGTASRPANRVRSE